MERDRTEVSARIPLRSRKMSQAPSPPPAQTRPAKPDPEANKVSCFGFMLLGFFLSIGATVLYFLTLGALGPFIVVAVCLMILIGGQYLLWGRWMEKVLKEGQAEVADEAQANVDADTE